MKDRAIVDGEEEPVYRMTAGIMIAILVLLAVVLAFLLYAVLGGAFDLETGTIGSAFPAVVV